jgi:hypothetical protein
MTAERDLQEALRVDVDLELEIALGLLGMRQPVAQIVRQIEITGRFEQQPEAVAALDDGEPSSSTPSSRGADATSRRAKPSAVGRSPAEMIRLASRPNGG